MHITAQARNWAAHLRTTPRHALKSKQLEEIADCLLQLAVLCDPQSTIDTVELDPDELPFLNEHPYRIENEPFGRAEIPIAVG